MFGKPIIKGGESEETAVTFTAYTDEKYISVHYHVWESMNLTFHWNADHTACTATRHCGDCGEDILIEQATEIAFVEDTPGADCREKGKGHYEAKFQTIEATRTESVFDTRPGPHVDADGNGLCDLCGLPPVDSYNDVTAETLKLTSGNWFVEGRLDLAASIVIDGGVTLYLAEGSLLNATHGIVVNQGNTLTILGEGDILAQGDDFAAGIGGASRQDAGTIVLNTLGTVTATGGYSAPGIGGGWNGADGTVTLGDKVMVVEGAVGTGHPYVKIAKKDQMCEGGAIADGEDGVWVITPNEGVEAVTIGNLPEEAKVAVKLNGYDIPSEAFMGFGEGGVFSLALNPEVVTPKIGELDAGEPFVVGTGEVAVTIKTIPGLKYSLIRGAELGKIDTTVVTTPATESQMTLKDENPPTNNAFYKVGVGK